MKKIDISRYEIKNKKIDQNIKIIFLSDLHNSNLKNDIVKIIKKENPSFIIMGGDMINESLNEINNYLDLCDELNNYKIYYVYGNHEEKLDEYEYREYNRIINNTNIINLKNKQERITKNINIIGFVSEIEKYQKFGKLTLDKKYILDKIGFLNKGKFNILIAHNPLEFHSYVLLGCDLVLSGHVHGGLIRLPLLGPLLSPDYTLFPTYSEGMYKKNNVSMIVSRGIGYSKRLPIRINNNPEIVVINLMKE